MGLMQDAPPIGPTGKVLKIRLREAYGDTLLKNAK